MHMSGEACGAGFAGSGIRGCGFFALLFRAEVDIIELVIIFV